MDLASKIRRPSIHNIPAPKIGDHASFNKTFNTRKSAIIGAKVGKGLAKTAKVVGKVGKVGAIGAAVVGAGVLAHHLIARHQAAKNRLELSNESDLCGVQ